MVRPSHDAPYYTVRPIHFRKAMAINSSPLSDLICSGGPWARNNAYSSSMTASASSFRSTRIDRHARVTASMMHSMVTPDCIGNASIPTLTNNQLDRYLPCQFIPLREACRRSDGASSSSSPWSITSFRRSVIHARTMLSISGICRRWQ